ALRGSRIGCQRRARGQGAIPGARRGDAPVLGQVLGVRCTWHLSRHRRLVEALVGLLQAADDGGLPEASLTLPLAYGLIEDRVSVTAGSIEVHDGHSRLARRDAGPQRFGNLLLDDLGR